MAPRQILLGPGAIDERASREAILDGAEAVFAREGLRAARTETIANTVGISKALIHYYFGTKEALYRAVLERIRADLESGVDFESLDRLPPPRALELHVTRLLEQMSAKPHLVPLFALESIQNDGAYYAAPAAAMSHLVRIIERGMADGSFRRVDARHTALNVTGVCLHYFNVMQNVRMLWPRAKNERTLMREHLTAALDFIAAALRAETALSEQATRTNRQPRSRRSPS